MRILVIGKDGQVGQKIQNLVNKTSDTNYSNYDFVFIGRDELDLSKARNIQAYFKKNKFDVAINCAAYTKVEQAEVNENDANLINHLAVKEIATIAKKNNMKLIHISTDFVFDGDKSQPYIETDTTSPINIYGKTKLAGEIAAISIMRFNTVILRTSWIYSEYGNNFVNTIIKNAMLKGKLNIISDQFGTPTYASDLAQTIIVGTFNLIEEAKSYWQSLQGEKKETFRFLHVSTDEVYGDLKASSDLFSEETPYNPSSPYSASKASSDHLVRAWYRTYGFPILITN